MIELYLGLGALIPLSYGLYFYLRKRRLRKDEMRLKRRIVQHVLGGPNG